LHGCGAGGDGDDEAEEAEGLQRQPRAAEPRDLPLPDVHLDGEEDGERPEGDAAEDAEDAVEEGQQDGAEGDEGHEQRAPHQAEHVDAAVLLLGAGPPTRDAGLHHREQRLQEHLEATHKVEHDAHVGEVHQPVGLVEAGEDVPRRAVAERRVAQAAAHQVERRRRHHAQDRRLPHRLVLGRRRSQRVLHGTRPAVITKLLPFIHRASCGGQIVLLTWISMRIMV
jgi:hypothetical protein